MLLDKAANIHHKLGMALIQCVLYMTIRLVIQPICHQKKLSQKKLVVLGCVMDMAPIILIATPILLPVATSIGIDLLTPPVGTCLFISSAISHLPIEKIAKAPLPFYLCMIIVLLLLTFVPFSAGSFSAFP